MSVRLAKTWYFSALVVSDRYPQPVINTYTVRVEMSATAQCNSDHNVAYARMRYWMQEIMSDAVLLDPNHATAAAWHDTGMRVMMLPEDPVDQLVGIMLYTKLCAMTEQRMTIHSVSVSSALDDDVIYHHYEDEEQGPLEVAGWWHDHRPIWQEKPHRKGKVISLDRQPDWRQQDLDWNQDGQDRSVVQGLFNQDEDQ